MFPVIVAAIAPKLLMAAPASTSAAEPSPPAGAVEPAGGPAGSVYVDPLGFLLFGPSVGVEVAAGHFSGLLYGRWLSVGLLAQSMFPNEEQDESFAFSYGVGVRGRYYFTPGLAGPYAGLGLEYLRTRIEDTKVDLIAVNAQLMMPHLEGGYRFGLGSFYVAPGAGLGYVAELSSGIENLPGGNRADMFVVDDRSGPYGTVSLDVGIYF